MKAQVAMGRIAILVSTALAAAWLIYTTPDGLYKYLQAISISIYLLCPSIHNGLFLKVLEVLR
jgi:hypothetical protein